MVTEVRAYPDSNMHLREATIFHTNPKPKTEKGPVFLMKHMEYVMKKMTSQSDEVWYVVVKKTVPRRNRRIMCVNRLFYVGTSFVVIYIFRYKSADANILGRMHLLSRKLRRISARKDREYR